MKETKIILGVIALSILMVSGAVLAGTGNGESQRVYVLTDNSAVKAMLGVNHEFRGAFSTKATMRAKILSSLGLIKTEPVQIYEITGRPVCGDGICQGLETPLTCPEDCGGDVECSPDNQYPWGIVKVNGGSGGEGITVAVLDTGVDTNHPDLVSNIDYCLAFGYPTCEDGNGHGTHVAGTILANGKIVGVAPQASLMAVKVCNDSGSCQGDDIAAGINYAADNGANIISMSLGGDSPDSLILAATDYAVDTRGVLVVAAAGNDGSSDGSIDYPAAYVKVLAVGAIDSGENVPYWSSRGINDGDDSVISEREVELGSPGVSVESTLNNGCYAYKSGTSMAAPHVSGLAAKLWQTTALDTRSYLITIAKDIDPLGYDTATGYGLPIAPEEACTADADCSDGNDCTTDSCLYPGTIDSHCENTVLEDGTACTGGICCSGTCSVATCSADGDCADAETCTTDTCNYPGTCDASCSNTWPGCDPDNSDGCCGPDCSSSNDADCVAEDFCGDDYCAGADLGEDCRTCPTDCPSGAKGVCCGDGKCDTKKGESSSFCPVDCE